MEKKNEGQIIDTTLIGDENAVENAGTAASAVEQKNSKTPSTPEQRDKNTIDLVAISSQIWRKKRVFMIVWAVVFLVSASLIVCVPRYYSTTTRVAPEMDGGAEGTLGSLASSFGFNLGDMGTTDAIYPLLYPDLMDDNGFVSKLFDIKVESADGSINTTYYDYIENYQKVAWWSKWIRAVKKLLPKEKTITVKKKGNDEFDPYQLSRKQFKVVMQMRDDITLAYDKKSSVISINTTAQDPLICKQLADSVRTRLLNYITTYRTEKARKDVEYYTSLMDEAKVEYEKVRQQYISFSDANIEIDLPSIRGKLDDLENDMQLKYNTYTAMNSQLEASRTKLREKTPAFTLLQGAAMPIKPAGPKRMIFVAFMLFLSTIVTALVVCRKLLPEVI